MEGKFEQAERSKTPTATLVNSWHHPAFSRLSHLNFSIIPPDHHLTYQSRVSQSSWTHSHLGLTVTRVYRQFLFTFAQVRRHFLCPERLCCFVGASRPTMASPRSALIVVDMQNDFCTAVGKLRRVYIIGTADTPRMVLLRLLEQETPFL